VLELSKLPHRTGAVFRRPDGQPYRRKLEGGGQIKTAFKGACRRAGIDDFSPHDCRHTWATWHYAANRDLPALMTLGGWKSEKMVLRYTHVNVGHLAQSIAALPWDDPGKQSGQAGGSVA
jgi:integrase